MKIKLISNNSKDLIIFLSGWGCDDKQFANIHSNKDILLVWDYTDLDFHFNFNRYNKFYLIAYSAGVFIAGNLENQLPKLKQKIAINGNPLIFDNYFGINADALQAMEKLSLDNYIEFRKNYIAANEEQFKYISANCSYRTIESCQKELKKLNNYYSQNNKIMNFDKVIISDSDKIFTPEKQIKYFKNNIKILKNYGHDVFSYFASLDDILNI